MLTKIWERYVLGQVITLFLLLLLGICLLYILIDYSSNSRDFANSQIDISTFITYYLCNFSKQLHLLIPFALLLAVMRTLCAMNASHELTALLANGVQLKVFMRPILLVGILCTLFLYANLQWILPGSLDKLDSLETDYFHPGSVTRAHVQSLALRDRSVLLYQSFDSTRKRFFDCYWIRSIDEIYRIKYLYPEARESLGHYVDHLKRNDERGLVKVASYQSHLFPELGFDDDVLGSAVVDADHLSISRLWELVNNRPEQVGDREVLLQSTLHAKLAIPWLCLLVVMAPAPFCTHFTRQLPVFMLFAGAIGTFVIFLTFFDAMLILAEGMVLPPLLAVWSPFIPSYGYVSYRYIRME